MAEPKDPGNTRPFAVGPREREVTRPIPTASGKTPASTSKLTEVTRPTAIYPKDAAAAPARPGTGTHPAQRTPTGRTGAVPRVGEKPTTRTGAVPRLGTGSVQRLTGSVPKVGDKARTGSVARLTGSVPRLGEKAGGRESLMSEGMRARRREIEKKKRRAAIERLRAEAELSEGWQRIWKTIGVSIVVLACAYGYWRVQQLHGNQWPLMSVWITLSILIVTGFGWILWYMNKGDI